MFKCKTKLVHLIIIDIKRQYGFYFEKKKKKKKKKKN